MRSTPPNVLSWSKKHRRTYHLPKSASCPSSTEPPSQGTGSLYRLKPRMQERSESAMQKPFPELINEPGETGRGQSRQPYPHPRHDNPRHGAGGVSERPALPLRAAAEGAALRLSARSSAQRELLRPGRRGQQAARRQGHGSGRAHLCHLHR